MTRSDNLKSLYHNLLAGSAPLQDATQLRIHRYARRTKDVELGAELARRSDTIASIDEDLASWAVARVQSAWFARPGRDTQRVAQRMREEKRITVLEVGAGLVDLDQDVYHAFAANTHPRIAIKLLENPSVDIATKMIAAKTVGLAMEQMSYTKRYEVLEIIKSREPGVVGSFVESLTDINMVTRMVQELPNVPERAALHLYALCRSSLATVVGLEDAFRKNAAKSASHWGTKPYFDVIDTVADAISAVECEDVAARASLEHDLTELLHHFKKRGRNEAETVERLNFALTYVSNKETPMRARVNQAAQAGSLTSLQRLVDSWAASDTEIDHHTAAAALTNEHIDVATAFKVVEAMHWRYRGTSNLPGRSDLRTEILGAFMVATWSTSDEDIEQCSAGRDTTEIWRAVVFADYANGGYVERALLDSKYAEPGIVPKLPFAVITQPGIPQWIDDAVGAYLEQHLTTEQEWDGFEILAKKHLGTLEQLIRGAKNATKRSK